MAEESLFRFFLGGASAYEGAQADPDDSLGGFIGTTPIASHEGTLTGVTTARVVIDSSLGATDLTGGWVVFHEGTNNNVNEVRKIIDHNTATDTLEFAELLPALPQVGDAYSVFMPGTLFGPWSADQTAQRASRFRVAYARNQTSGQRDNIRTYVRTIQPGPLVCDVAMAVSPFPQLFHWDLATIPDETTPPDLTMDFGGTQDFLHSVSWSLGTLSPYGTEGGTGQKSMVNDASVFSERPLWVRLSFPPGASLPLASQAVFQVFVDAGGGFTEASFLVVVDIPGVVEQILAVVDRRLRLRGGARASCFVRDSAAPNEPVPGRSIRINLDSGPGTLNPQNDSVQRADGEPIRRVYESPTDEVNVGDTVVFNFEVT